LSAALARKKEKDMNVDQAKRCAETLEDVFTVNGDAGVIEELDLTEHPYLARVDGRLIKHRWFRLNSLTAKEDL
jgi:hypothetical protein